jgi:hypothetical protein
LFSFIINYRRVNTVPFWSLSRADLPATTLADGTTGFSLGMGFAWMGNTLLELVQPLDERLPRHAFLTRNGEGLHHLRSWSCLAAGPAWRTSLRVPACGPALIWRLPAAQPSTITEADRCHQKPSLDMIHDLADYS